MQIQRELDSLAEQAAASVVDVIRGEAHVFTNDASYMELLNNMRAHILRKQGNSREADKIHTTCTEVSMDNLLQHTVALPIFAHLSCHPLFCRSSQKFELSDIALTNN